MRQVSVCASSSAAERGGRDHRREADRIDEARQRVAEPVDDLGLGADEAAAGGEALRQRADDQVDVVGVDARVFAEPAPLVAEHADRMRLVEQQPGRMLLLQLDETRQIDDVAVHREQAFGDDQRRLVQAALLGEQLVEVLEVVVAEEDHVGRRRLAARDDRVVRQLVEEDDAARAHDVLDDGDVGEVAGDQRHHRLDADESSQSLLEILVAGPLAADEARGEGAEAGHVERVGRRRLDGRGGR